MHIPYQHQASSLRHHGNIFTSVGRDTVRVALLVTINSSYILICVCSIRPKLPKDIAEMNKVCTRVAPGEPQVWLGHDKAFTFDQVFDIGSDQSVVYDKCVRELVDG